MTKTTTAVALVPTPIQKQQVVAAFTVSGTMARARPLIATLWGVDEADVPDDVQLRAWVADSDIVPEKEYMALAERMAQSAHRASLLDLEDEAIKSAKALVKEGSPKFYNLVGLIHIIGKRIDPMMAAKTTIFDLRGASFKTSRPRGARMEEQAAIKGEFTELDVEGD
jgi:hypothetical protein